MIQEDQSQVAGHEFLQCQDRISYKPNQTDTRLGALVQRVSYQQYRFSFHK